MGTFLFCWLPFFIVNILKPFLGRHISPGLFQAVTWLGYANSSANPIIYSIFNRDFRRAFHRILTYCCCRGRSGSITGGFPLATTNSLSQHHHHGPPHPTQRNNNEDSDNNGSSPLSSRAQGGDQKRHSLKEPVETFVALLPLAGKNKEQKLETAVVGTRNSLPPLQQTNVAEL